MSFELVCPQCGAPSSPSVGVCPFCKSVMSHEPCGDSPSIELIHRYYEQGRLESALELGSRMLKSNENLKASLNFIHTYLKVLFEAEAPISQMRSLISEALLHHPGDSTLIDYLEILEAKRGLRKGLNDQGEVLLRALLRRSPQNAHAHFILGAHLFWTDSEPTMAIPHLEACVRLHPSFLRAWGCLGAIYKKLGHRGLAQQAFRKCLEIETEPKMRALFEQELKSA